MTPLPRRSFLSMLAALPIVGPLIPKSTYAIGVDIGTGPSKSAAAVFAKTRDMGHSQSNLDMLRDILAMEPALKANGITLDRERFFEKYCEACGLDAVAFPPTPRLYFERRVEQPGSSRVS